MELLLFFMIAAVGGFWWINHTMKQNAERKANEQAKLAEYKVEPAPVVESATVAEPTPAVVEAAAPVKKAKKPSKPKAVVTTAAKKPRASRAKTRKS